MNLQDYIDVKLVHEIHTSERKNFRSCRRRWDWSTRESYYPKTTAKPLEFGTAYHAAMEVLYAPATWEDDRDVVEVEAIIKFVEVCEEQRNAALTSTNTLRLEPDVQIDYDARVELGKGMISYYAREVAPKEDMGYTPVKVEVPFMVPIRNFETGEDIIWCRCDICWTKFEKAKSEVIYAGWGPSIYRAKYWQGLPVVAAGRIDALLQDDRGGIWVVDWKTAALIDLDKDFLELDDQVATYTWALDKIGLNIRGFIYHEQLKGFPKPPEKLTRKYKGCLFSTSKTQHTEFNMFRETVMNEDPEGYLAGSYDSYLQFLQLGMNKYYDRQLIYKGAEELEEVERALCSEALEMTNPYIRIYPSPSKFGCNWCAFKVPCLEKNTQGDYLYTLDSLFDRKEHYYELAEKPTTEMV